MSNKIYTTAYRLGMLNVHNESDKVRADRYKELLLECLDEIKAKGHQLI